MASHRLLRCGRFVRDGFLHLFGHSTAVGSVRIISQPLRFNREFRLCFLHCVSMSR